MFGQKKKKRSQKAGSGKEADSRLKRRSSLEETSDSAGVHVTKQKHDNGYAGAPAKSSRRTSEIELAQTQTRIEGSSA